MHSGYAEQVPPELRLTHESSGGDKPLEWEIGPGGSLGAAFLTFVIPRHDPNAADPDSFKDVHDIDKFLDRQVTIGP